ncbi:DUF6264 family protein [Curtobacterium sp. Leaf261]|uniref:DUF6264 family protein n=1 Tax=Curtobacterium sp. Leaf261 TaxID=1736311 RepID=UPI0006F6CA80|nr:DUF6264 family protein [Curtobacterium sp. Leaf261]KQO62829.1 hypothetical protein ASF23_07840 [Curtobacterium sp. Leaf261]
MTDPHEVPLPQQPPAQQPPAQQPPVPQTGTTDGREARHAPALSADGRPIGRPAPRYGEYAPEGWVNPAEVERQRRERAAAEQRRELAALEAARARATRSVPPGRNRGTPPHPDPRRPDQPRSDRARPGAARSPYGASPGDLMITVLLLVFGLTTVLQQLVGIGNVASQVARQIEERYVALEDPQALVPATVLSAVVGAVLFAAALWLSIVRLRRRQVTFWVPLAAGALAGAVTTIVYVVVVMHDPAFVSWIVTHRGGA